MQGMDLTDLIAFTRTFQLESFYARRESEGTYEVLFGEDDPEKVIEALRMEISVLKSQLRTAMEMYYRDLTEAQRGKAPNGIQNVCSGEAGRLGKAESDQKWNLPAEDEQAV